MVGKEHTRRVKGQACEGEVEALVLPSHHGSGWKIHFWGTPLSFSLRSHSPEGGMDGCMNRLLYITWIDLVGWILLHFTSHPLCQKLFLVLITNTEVGVKS